MFVPPCTLDGLLVFSLPEDLLKTLDLEPSVAYTLDEDLKISYCNPAWDRFARENSGDGAHTADLYGKRILDSISEPLKSFYKNVYLSALQTGEPWQQVYECSTPTLYRRFRMHVLKIEGLQALVITNFLEIECSHSSDRQPMAVDSHLYLSPLGILAMCSNCRRVRQAEHQDAWDWVREYVLHRYNNISHGICPICIHHFLCMA